MIFYKTVSSGNDFIQVNVEDLRDPGDKIKKGKLARRLCQRQTGIGADGMVFYKYKNAGESRFASAAVDFEIFNRDGSEAELSGNGMAGLAALLFYLHENSSKHPQVLLDTKTGKKKIRYLSHRDNKYRLKIEIAEPDFQDRMFFPFLEKEKNKAGYSYEGITFYPVSLGNPHAVVVLEENVPHEELARMGKGLENARIFPARANVELVVPTGTGPVNYEIGRHFRIFYYERGVGPTLSSSTGNAAVFAVLRELRLIERCLTVRIPMDSPGAQCPGEVIKISGKPVVSIENSTEIVYKGEYISE